MTEPKLVESGSLTLDVEVDRLVYDACRLRSVFFALNVSDVEAEENRQASSPTALPEQLLDANSTWLRATQRRGEKKFKPATDCSIVENLARAARLGTSIPRDVEERMRRDRQSAEAENGI